jgi:hypothetical protein
MDLLLVLQHLDPNILYLSAPNQVFTMPVTSIDPSLFEILSSTALAVLGSGAPAKQTASEMLMNSVQLTQTGPNS